MRACLPTIIGAASRLSGVHAIKAIRAEFLDVRVIALTTYEGDEAIYRERVMVKSARAAAAWSKCG
jgi:hypothetical protein